MKRLTALSLSLVVTFLPLAAARAHVTLERPEAAVGGGYKAIFRVPHGCSESPTVKVRVRIPEGVIGVKPMPKAGWQLEPVKAKYDKPYQMYHSTLTEGVREVTWTGKLLDENYDEFVLSTYLAEDLKPDTILYFPVVQECETGVHRWIEIPEAGKSEELREPAPRVKLLPRRP